MNIQKPAPLHTYQVAYKRLPGGMVYTQTFESTSVQRIVDLLTQLEADGFQVDILLIAKIS